MKFLNLKVIVFSFMLGLGSAAQATVIGADFTGGDTYGSGSFNNIGWSFEVTSTIAVDGLGIFDRHGNGLAAGHQVGLWDAGGTLLTQTTVTNASVATASASGLGNWLFEDITAITLVAGNYVIGAFYTDSDPDVVMASVTGLTTMAGVNYLDSLASNSASFSMPGAYGLVEPGVFGPNFRAHSVPEPASILLFVLGLFGVSMLRRR
ncbi:PEP-CTERM sorting domain-containing protein [Simiduia aestuariiviva]|uniref:Ice-binding protein C-terminal domain-containing protein n=1 Tax=Simiduia aestuariiviva TaxID=1510459 RepID=A0A839UNB8_9GAMM|nr:PEP-CTERM sorting domain-containing protein [Simiduia aestuariiviva]MBB3168039.1 hypothetical protein [Simiduia aestuariiviva]